MDCKLEGRGESEAMPRGVDTITLDGGDLKITFHRTIRVPDNSASESLLPPDLGVFPFFPAKEARPWRTLNGQIETQTVFPSQVPDWLRAKGGVFFPMHENEATWINFDSKDGRPYAIKVYAGDVNAVSGLPSTADAAPDQQDYVVIPEQRWLDGIAVKAGLVRQFVAVPLGRNSTVEGQITGSERFGGIQFEVVKGIVWKRFRVYCGDGTEIILSVDDRENVDELCRIISEKLGKTLGANDLYDKDKMVRLGRSRNEKLRETGLKNIGIVDSQNTPLLEELYKKEHRKYDFPQFYSTEISRDSPAEFGLAAGGFIKQSIQKDTHPASTWDFTTKIVFNVQLISAQVFEEMTGFKAPVAPINAATYRKYGLPFFHVPESPSTITGDFGRLKSLAHLRYISWWDNDIVLAPASDSGEFRSVNEHRQEEDRERQRLTPVQTMVAPEIAQILMLRREIILETESCDSRSQEGSIKGKTCERTYHVSSTTSQEGTGAQDSDDFYPDFDDGVEELPDLPFGSSAQEVWSRIYRYSE